MDAIERRISRMSHPDLPFDAATLKHDSTSPRTSWRPSWMTRSSMSGHSHSSSLSTSRSASVSTRRTTANMRNVYQLPNSPTDHTKDEEQPERQRNPALSDMRYEYMDETFDFPLPAAIQIGVPPTDSVVGDGLEFLEQAQSNAAIHVKSASSCYSSASRFDATSSVASRTSLASVPSTRPTTSVSAHHKTRDPIKDQETEIEMVSKEQFGYWNASFVTRIPATAALCGAVLLTTRMAHRQTATSIATTRYSSGHAAVAAAEFASELYSATTPEELMRIVRQRGLGSAALMLKASLDVAQIPGIPLKNAMAMFKSAKQAAEEDHPKLWSHVLKQLKKMPQDRLVLVIFLVCVARKLRRQNVMIDGLEASLYLLQGLWPSSLAINDDPAVAQKLSRLLVSHFDEFPTDFPTNLAAINYRFASGNRYNVLSLMTEKKHQSGPEGVREIGDTEHRSIPQW